MAALSASTSAETRDEKDLPSPCSFSVIPPKFPTTTCNTPVVMGTGISDSVDPRHSVKEGMNISKQGQYHEIGLLSPQNKGWGVREGFVGTRWEMQDEMQQPVKSRWSNQTVVTLSQHHNPWLWVENSRFPHSNHFIRNPARLLLFPLALDP